MTTFEKLDFIADSYNPMLLLFSLALVALTFKSEGTKLAGIKLGLLLVLTFLVYIFQLVDNYLNLWSSFGLDYSTHTAFSIAIVYFVLYNSRKTKIVIMFSFLGYLILMLYQKYHTVADILTTIAVISPFMYIASNCANQLVIRSTRVAGKK